jgi:hypothetical protein
MLCRAAVRRAGVELPRWRAEPSEREKGAGMIILAHAFGARYELPLPLVYFVLGAGIVVLASFALLTRRPFRRPGTPPLLTGCRWARYGPCPAWPAWWCSLRWWWPAWLVRRSGPRT